MKEWRGESRGMGLWAVSGREGARTIGSTRGLARGARGVVYRRMVEEAGDGGESSGRKKNR